MPATYEQAVDAMLTAFWLRWNNQVKTLVGYTPQVVWPKRHPTKPDPSKHWARVTIQTVTENKVTLRTRNVAVTPTPKSRLRSQGFIIVQLFFSQNSLIAGDDEKISEVVRKGFIDPLLDGTLEWQNPTKQELNPEGEVWYRNNVTATFEYDELV